MVSVSDAVDQMICRWAEAKYDLSNVERVVWEPDCDYGWSEYTPGDGPYLRVDVYTTDRPKQPHSFQEWEKFDAGLLRDILRFSVEGVAA